MVFKGTARRSARELSFDIENAGGQINACTSEDQTVYEGRGEAELLPVLADVLCDMVWNATFPEPEIQLEREVIGEEITMYRESPADHIGDLISKRCGATIRWETRSRDPWIRFTQSAVETLWNSASAIISATIWSSPPPARSSSTR